MLTRTAQQIDITLMHPPKKFRQNLLVRIHFMKEFNFLIHDLEHRKNEASSGKCLCFPTRRLLESDVRQVKL